MANQKKDKELFAACEKQDVSRVKTRLLIGGDPCHVIKGKNYAPIHMTVLNDDDNKDILHTIISSGKVTDVNVRTAYDNTSLLLACIKGNVKCAKLLVDYGADVTVKNKYDNGATHCSVNSGNPAMVEECLKWNGIDVNQRGAKSKTALVLACEKGYMNMVKILLAAEADVGLRDQDAHSAIWYARKNSKITEMLVRYAGKQSKKRIRSSFPSEVPAPELSTAKVLPTASELLPAALELPTAPPLPTESSFSGINQNAASLAAFIKRVFPKFDQLKVDSIVDLIGQTGVDYNDFDVRHLMLLKESDLEFILKPIEARLFLSEIEKEYGGQNSVVINF